MDFLERQLTIVKGLRKNEIVYRDEMGFVYWNHHKNRNPMTYRCRLYKCDIKCPARGKVFEETPNVMVLVQNHNHEAADEVPLREFRGQLNNRAQNELTPMRVVYNQLTSREPFANVRVKRYESYRRTMARSRKDGHPPNPQTMEEFSLQLDGPYNERTKVLGEITYAGTLRDPGEGGISIIFITPETRRLLRESTDIFIDGTFDAAPLFGRECQQVLIIMAKSFGYGFPIVFALMSRKTRVSYDNLIDFLRQLEPNWNPLRVMSDFERAIIGSFEQHFPNCRHSGCFFHLGQAVWKRVQSSGLTNLAKNNYLFWKIVHMLMALPLLPSQSIIIGFNSILNYFNELIGPIPIDDPDREHRQDLMNHSIHISQFLNYYGHFWITDIGTDVLSVYGRYDRTNNILEASHKSLINHFTNSNPAPWSFVERLLPYIGGVTKDVRQAREGIELHRDQPLIWQQQNGRIHRAQRQLITGQITVFEFLIRCSHTTPQFGVPVPMNNYANGNNNMHNNGHDEQEIEEVIVGLSDIEGDENDDMIEEVEDVY